ncbi:glycosyltransferase [Luteolibacter sp. Populi]|uniref:glycosyltransferase n=1 Tax=Luteolibacter sp. Populi TaxID=3230487 RepID=UPI0034666C4A
MIRIAISSDAKGHGNSATLIASILRRTEQPVQVRCWCRGYLPESFESGALKVEFFPAEEEVTGRYPGHVPQAVFDRLRIIRDGVDWERCLIMDHDMIALCDLAPYFAENFEGNLLMGRLFGPGNTLGVQMKQRGGLPEGWKHAESHPYFFMGPMMNLAAMRSEGIWDKLLEAHAAIGQDEQLSLTAACGGRTKGVSKRWNIVPQWDGLASAVIPRSGRAEVGGIPFLNGIPEGIIHWTGGSKPWQRGTKVWRSDLWESERTSWEHLRAGIWEKPVAIEVEPEDGTGVRALARRGWRVEVFGERFSGGEPRLDERDEPHPDVILGNGGPARFRTLLEQRDFPVEIVRFGSGTRPGEWLESVTPLPEYVALRGPVDEGEVRRLRSLGYWHETRLQSIQWPGGGPAPRVLEYRGDLPVLAAGAGEDVYLKLGEAAEGLDPLPAASAAAQAAETVEWPWQISETSEAFLNRLAEEVGDAGRSWSILELGSGQGTAVLAECFPESQIVSLEHHAAWFVSCRGNLRGYRHVELRHAPLDGTLPWYDCRGIDFEPVDLLFVTCPTGTLAKAVRGGAPALRRYLKAGGRVVLDGMDEKEKGVILSRWLETGGMRVEYQTEACVSLIGDSLPDFHPACAIPTLQGIAEKIYVISLPEREDRREILRRNWQPQDLEFEVVEGVRPDPAEIRWEEMKGMEAYGSAENLRGEYIPGAVGCKRAGINALKNFLDSRANTALICQDDCLWKPDAPRIIGRALRELPEDWDLVYFSASSRDKNLPYSPHLVRLGGARYCNAILWNRASAKRLLPELENADCEWDLFMQRSHAWLQTYCVVPMPAYQGKSRSDIVQGIVQPPNR